MMKLEAKKRFYGIDFYWGGKRLATIAPRRITLFLSQPKNANYNMLTFAFGFGRQTWWENRHIGQEYKFHYQSPPQRGLWYVLVNGRTFHYWQVIAILREIRRVNDAAR